MRARAGVVGRLPVAAVRRGGRERARELLLLLVGVAERRSEWSRAASEMKVIIRQWCRRGAVKRR